MTIMHVGEDKPFGYHGAALVIDVTDGRATHSPLPATTLRKYLGGSGLGTHLLLRWGAAELPASDPQLPLAFVFSPLVGSPLTTSAKFAVCCKSPLTHRINDALASSAFALAGKKCGADALVLVGRAPQLSVLVIDDGIVRCDAADDLAGLTIPATERALRDRYGSDFSFAVIGPAGERGVPFATISHDGRHAGRGGSGAVLGAKNIKALAVRGEQRVDWAFPGELAQAAKELSAKSFGPATAKYRELGTASNLLTFNRLHALPTRNFQQGSFDAAVDLSPESLQMTRDKTRASCAACTIGCEHLYAQRPTAADASPKPVRLEYENLFALGPLCGIRDPDAVLAASQRCDELGLDTISTGGTIAFAMECVERGLWDQPWLRFGDANALAMAIEQTVDGSGAGQWLALGSRQLAAHVGGGSERFAPHVKGLEIPGYEPRALQTMALGLAVGSRGADHNRSGAYEADFSDRVDRRRLLPENARFAVETEDKAAIMDSLILCKFIRGALPDFFTESAHLLRLVTGWDVTADELQATARRIVNAKKRFNERAGWTPAEDTLPPRFLEQSLPDDSQASLTADALGAAIHAYNKARGWSPEGWLPPDVRHALDSADVPGMGNLVLASAVAEEKVCGG